MSAAVCLSLFILVSPSPLPADPNPPVTFDASAAQPPVVVAQRVAPASCSHTHSRAESRRAVRIIMRSPLRVSKARGRKVWHYLKCVRTAATAHYMRESLKHWKAWRRSYTGKWRLAWERLPPAGKSWTKIVSWRESRNRRYAPESGFLSYFQWIMPTWRAACGCSMHPYAASWDHQAVVAWYWHLGHPSGQWPNTGEG